MPSPLVVISVLFIEVLTFAASTFQQIYLQLVGDVIVGIRGYLQPREFLHHILFHHAVCWFVMRTFIRSGK